MRTMQQIWLKFRKNCENCFYWALFLKLFFFEQPQSSFPSVFLWICHSTIKYTLEFNILLKYQQKNICYSNCHCAIKFWCASIKINCVFKNDPHPQPPLINGLHDSINNWTLFQSYSFMNNTRKKARKTFFSLEDFFFFEFEEKKSIKRDEREKLRQFN